MARAKKKKPQKIRYNEKGQRVITRRGHDYILPDGFGGATYTKYKPEYCLKVIELMSQGASKQELLLEMDSRPTLLTLSYWAREHPEFKKALDIGQALSEAWWMREGRRNIYNKDFNAVLYMMQMMNRFGWTRRENINAKIHKHDETTLNVRFDFTKLSPKTVLEVLNASAGNGGNGDKELPILPDWKEEKVVNVTPKKKRKKKIKKIRKVNVAGSG